MQQAPACPGLRTEDSGGRLPLQLRVLCPRRSVSIRLGLDVGSVSVKLAAVGERDDARLLGLVDGSQKQFFSPKLAAGDGLADRMVVLSAYRQIQGNPMQAVRDLLRDFLASVPEDAVSAIGVTGSAGRAIAQEFHAHFENEFRALARSVRALYPQVRTVATASKRNPKIVFSPPKTLGLPCRPCPARLRLRRRLLGSSAVRADFCRGRWLPCWRSRLLYWG
jgi:hypothetical protein